MFKIKNAVLRHLIQKISFVLGLFLFSPVQAIQNYTPSDVFAGVKYANQLTDNLLAKQNITDIKIPLSRESAAKPMHVYELHVSILNELYHYAIKNNRRPPPLVSSTPIKYTPTDVYYLTQLVIDNLEGLYKNKIGVIEFSESTYINKSPVEVYQALFELFYKVNRLNNKPKVSPSEVYAHIYRAKEDLQYSLLTLSKRLNENHEDKKRLLVTAIYGMHPDGGVISQKEEGKKPADVMQLTFEVRSKLNILRQRNKLPEIKTPTLAKYKKIKPIDVFLQTQFIIAELNLIKMTMKINSTTNNAKYFTGKTPSDVFQEVKHINYMLDRIINTL